MPPGNKQGFVVVNCSEVLNWRQVCCKKFSKALQALFQMGTTPINPIVLDGLKNHVNPITTNNTFCSHCF